MVKDYWKPVAKQDKDSSSLLTTIIMFVLTLLIGVLIWKF